MNQYFNSRRMPAEWELQDAILMAFPHEGTDWNYMLPEITKCYIDMIKAMIPSGETIIIITPEPDKVKSILKESDIEHVVVIGCDTNDTWTRDYGALSIELNNLTPKLLDFKFNGWGLKFASCYDNLVNLHLAKCNIYNSKPENHLGFVLEGGSIESDGEGTIMTTSECLLSPNRNGGNSKAEIESYLKTALGAYRVLWLNHGYLAGDDTDSHVDTLARFIDNHTIAYVKCYDKADEHYYELSLMEDELKQFRTISGDAYTLVALPLPDAIYDEEGERLPATYANFLIMNDRVILPIYNQANNDTEAIKSLTRAFPNKKITPLDANALIKQHGSIHCATMQFAKGNINKNIMI
ncbi:MAG: agmatine deiminase family protein [Muribaculaceae bacterium]|nr:agmatine deiminase family protein [Muribaculaceae bacterium]